MLLCHSQRIHPIPLPICTSTWCRIDAKIWELLPAGTPRWHDTRLLQVSMFPLLSFNGTEHCSQGWLCVQKGELWAEQGVLLQAELDLLSGVPRQGRRWRAGSRATRWGEGFQMRAMLLSKCRYFELEKIHFFINTSLLWTLFFLCLNVVMITLFRCNFCLSKGHERSPFYELWTKIKFINTA